VILTTKTQIFFRMQYKYLIILLVISAFPSHAQKLDQKAWQEAAVLAKQGQHSRALQRYKDALMTVRDQNLFRQAASALQQAGAAGEPEQLYLWGRSLLKDKRAFARELAELYQAQLSYSKAIPQWALVFETQPDYARIRLTETAEVHGYLLTARSLDKSDLKKNDAALVLLGDLYRKAGDYERSLDLYNRVTKQEIWLQAVTALATGPGPGLVQQEEIINGILRREPADKAYWQVLLAGNYEKQGFYDKALRVYEALNDSRAGLYSARIYYDKMHLPQKALAIIDKNIGTWPELLRNEGLFLRAGCFIVLGVPDSAVLIYSRLSDSLNPPGLRQPALYQWGELELMRQDFDQALNRYRQTVLMGTQDDAVNDALARLLLITSYKTDKINILKTWSQGLKCQRQFDYGRAGGFYREVIAADSGGQLQALSLQGLAQMAMERGDFKQAAEDWGQLSVSASDSNLAAEAFYQKGLIQRDKLNEGKKAVQVWEQGIIAYPNTLWADLMREELEKSRTRNSQ
jgi:tetratricopeptide (TPR) repeat protein